MKCTILHESVGRMRVHMCQCYMTLSEADALEAYLNSIPSVKKAKVNERTANAIICYDAGGKGKELKREEIISSLAAFGYDKDVEEAVESTGRKMRHDFEDRIAFMLLTRLAQRLLLPVYFRRSLIRFASLRFIRAGVLSLLKGKLSVSVLDAASILVNLLKGQHGTAASVMFLLQFGEELEDWTHRKSVADLAEVMSLNVDRVWVKTESGSEELRSIDEIKTGDEIVVHTGHLIPLDGEVCEGDAMVNQAAMTGEALAVHKTTGGYVYAGSVIEDGSLGIIVRSESGSGRYDRIVEMIEDSERLKSSAEAKASKMADSFVPLTFGATLATYLLTRDINRAVSIMMVDFCCALKLSTPIAVLSCMREAGERKISVKGGKSLEAYAEATVMVFDKTGTLTKATPKVRDIIVFGDNDKDEMLRLAACLEEHFPHSLANAVVEEAKNRGLAHEEKHSRVEYVVAHGIASSIDGKKVCIGSHHFIFEDEKVRLPDSAKDAFDALPADCSRLYLAIGDELSAVILIEDPLKEEAKDAILKLHEAGFDKIVMMTGDSRHTAASVAKEIGVDDYYAEVLPEDKAGFIQKEHKAGRTVVMIGDGINDTPALSAADVGVAINSGAAIAREICDISISQDDLYALITVRKLSEALAGRIHRNYVGILSFNGLLIFLGALGILPSTMTALLHNASTLYIGLNSMTDLLKKP